MPSNYIDSAIKQFRYYKSLGDNTFAQLPCDKLNWQYNDESNSIATIIQHLHGNMLSRFTNFLTSDGEKEWRNRDTEFDHANYTKEELLSRWEAGWHCLFTAIEQLGDADLQTIIYIRNEGHTVQEAINRQLCHYPYHVGQIAFLGKMIAAGQWQSLSIAKGNSTVYNDAKFAQPKERKHFTDGV